MQLSDYIIKDDLNKIIGTTYTNNVKSKEIFFLKDKS